MSNVILETSESRIEICQGVPLSKHSFLKLYLPSTGVSKFVGDLRTEFFINSLFLVKYV